MMPHIKYFRLIFLLMLGTFSACGSDSFSGDTANKTSEKTDASSDQTPEQQPTTPAQESEQVSLADAETILSEDGDMSQDDKKLLGCLSEWGELPFSREELKGYRKLQSNSQGFSAGAIKDTKKTEKPRLVMVKTNSVGFSGVTIELFNPNGWYCLDIENVGFSSAKILVTCQAEIAGNNTTNTGFSNTQETRVGC